MPKEILSVECLIRHHRHVVYPPQSRSQCITSPTRPSQLRNIAAPFLERLAISRITLILAPLPDN